MPKTAPKAQLTAVTALNPWCCVVGASDAAFTCVRPWVMS